MAEFICKVSDQLNSLGPSVYLLYSGVHQTLKVLTNNAHPFFKLLCQKVSISTALKYINIFPQRYTVDIFCAYLLSTKQPFFICILPYIYPPVMFSF